MNNVGVKFKNNGKEYIFYDNNIDVFVDDYVIVETEKGQQFGKVSSISKVKLQDENHSKIIKIAEESDIKQNKKNIVEAKLALEKATEIAKDLNLDMKFIDSYYTFDKSQLVFQFLADNRIDFRELAKSLASIYKVRIELRQVGVRDKAKEISGIGQCGRKLCCSSFLKDLDSVGIAQVKNQGLSLNPSKINGQCGRLLCCLKYEDSNYSLYRKGMPEVGDKVKVGKESGVVTSLDILNRKYTLNTENNNKIVVEVPLEKMSNEWWNNKRSFKLQQYKNLSK